MASGRIDRALQTAAALWFAVIMSACSAAPTRVTLLPDQAGGVGAVVVGNAHGQQLIDQAYASAEVGSAGAPRLLASGKREAFEKTHRALIEAQPTAPRSFVLYFRFDSMDLTPESRQQLPEVFEAVRERLPTEVTVFGYTDSVGAPEYNLALSAERARAVAAMLRKIDPDLPVEVEYFGDKAPLVPARRGQPEPRNRRAEIFVL